MVLVCDFIVNGNCVFHKAEQFIRYSRAIASICGRRPFYTASMAEQFVTPNWIGMFGGLFLTDFEHFHFFVSFLVVALQ
jgi:thiosulfate reductase cytochrome b subunit